MSNIKIQGEVSLDTSNVDAALARVTSGASKMASAVGKAGKDAGDGISKIGDGGDLASDKVEKATKSLIGSIQRTTAALEAGSKSGAEYYESLAKQRGVDVSVLRPYLAQLDAVKDKQEAAARSAEFSAKAFLAIGAAAGIGIVGFVRMIDGAIEAADNMRDLSKTTGIAVEQLAGLQLAAKQSGGDLDGIAKSINKLSINIGKDGDKFKALGISAKDPIEAFKQLSDIFVRIEDPQRRAALATVALGKSWEGSAPLLSEGSKSIGEMIEKGTRLSRMTEEMTDQADKFKDSMAEMSAAANGLKMGLASEMLPALNEITQNITLAYEESGKLAAVWTAMGALGTFLFTDDFASTASKIRTLKVELEDLQSNKTNASSSIPLLPYLMFGSPEAWDADIAAKKKQIADLIESTKPKAKVEAPKETPEQIEATRQFIREQKEKADAAESAAKSAEKARQSFIKSLEKEAETYGMTATQSKLYEASLLGIKGKQLDRVKSTLSVFDAEKKAAEAVKASAAEYKKYIDNLDSGNEKLAAQVKAQEEYNARIGLGKDELAALDAAEMEHQAVTAESIAMTMDMMDWSGKLGDAYRKQAEELRNLAALKITGASKQIGFDISKKAQDDLNKFLDPKKAQTFGEALKGAFGGAGDALGKLTSSLQAYSIKEAEIAQAKKDFANDTTSSDSERAEKAIQLAEKETAYRIGSYGDIADAASGFFDKQSSGYRALQTAAQIFHAAELAMTLGGLAAKGISAVLTQGEGDPYSAFGRMAAMAAIVGGLGVAIGGVGGSGGAGVSSADAQKTQGTGAAFGDASKKSDSIAKAIELTAKNSAIELSHTGGMLSALQNIESSIGGLANIVFRTNGVTDGSNFNVNTGKFDSAGSALSAKGLSILPQDSFTKKLNDATGKFIFGSSSTSITDGGLQYGGSLSALQQGNGINQYANVNTTKKGALGGLFGGNSSVNTVQTQAVSGELSQQFAQIFIGVQAALTSAAVGMGLGADKVTSVLNSLTLASTNVSLKGLSGQALTDAINAVISKSLDEISSAAFPELTSFRKVGEGFAETVVRIASDYQNLDSVLQSIGATFGEVGLSSIAARERLLDLAGGVDNLAKQTSSFAENYLTEAERLAPVAQYVSEQLAALGKSGIKTRDDFKDAVLGLANSGALATEAGAKTYAGLLNIADAFAKVTPAIDSAAIAAQAMADAAARISAIASERTGLETELLNLQGNKAELRKRELLQLDESNRALKQSIFDLQDKQALEAENQAASQKTGDAAAQAADQIQSAWKSVADSLIGEANRINGIVSGNSASNLSGAQSQFAIATAQARAGDIEAAKLLPSLSQALLALAQKDATSELDLQRLRALTSNSLLQTAGKLPSYAVGTSYVPHDMIAQIHEGEAIIPKAQNLQNMNGGSDRLAELLEAVKMEISKLRASQEKNNEDTKRGADVLQGRQSIPLLVQVVS